ncbi:MAG: cupin domain-containing protein, partial [Luteimonas sp.]
MIGDHGSKFNHRSRSHMDSLTYLLTHFSLQVGVFYTGQLCGLHDFERDNVRGHLHLMRRGQVRLIGLQSQVLDITEPTLIFLPRPDSHRLLADEQAGADVVGGNVLFGGGRRNPITDSLPEQVQVQLRDMPGVDVVLDLLFAEAFDGLPGRQAILDRLCEVLIVRLLRH